MSRLKLSLILIFVGVVSIGAYSAIHRAARKPATQTGGAATTTQQTGTTQEAKGNFNKKLYSNDDPSSLWVIVNKLRPLNPKEYAPQLVAPGMKLRLAASDPEMQISTAMRADLEQLAKAADRAGQPLMLASGYRSYYTQVSVYNNEVATYGQATADRESARPGYSEHQTGLAADLAPASGKCVVADCFGDLPEGKWLAAHAHEYGFVIRYVQGQETTTGYRYEPWHVRYVGRALAAEVNRLGNPTLEMFFGLPAAADYAP